MILLGLVSLVVTVSSINMYVVWIQCCNQCLTGHLGRAEKDCVFVVHVEDLLVMTVQFQLRQ
jgi:hypothetical protein